MKAGNEPYNLSGLLEKGSLYLPVHLTNHRRFHQTSTSVALVRALGCARVFNVPFEIATVNQQPTSL